MAGGGVVVQEKGMSPEGISSKLLDQAYNIMLSMENAYLANIQKY